MKGNSTQPRASWRTLIWIPGFVLGVMLLLGNRSYCKFDTVPINKPPSEQQQAEQCYEKFLPTWIHGDAEMMGKEFEIGSRELSDKYDDSHRFFYGYHPYLSNLVLQKLKSSRVCSGGPKPKIKFMEIGLGCEFGSGGMKGGTPGGSAFGWRALFQNLAPVLDFELHLFEYAGECITKWNKDYPGVASMIHIGDAANEVDLMRVVNETGSSHDFDVIIDDASHINWHMIKTFEVLIHQVQLGGLYIVEDIHSSCYSWKANMGATDAEMTGGTDECMYTTKGIDDPTFFGKIVEWQRALVSKKVPFKDVNHIDFRGSMVVFEKQLPQKLQQWIDRPW